jgi:hypothetical protein
MMKKVFHKTKSQSAPLADDIEIDDIPTYLVQENAAIYFTGLLQRSGRRRAAFPPDNPQRPPAARSGWAQYSKC